VNPVVFIPTRGTGRVACVERLAASIRDSCPEVVIFAVSERKVKADGAVWLRLGRWSHESAVGLVRRRIVNYAAENRIKSFLMADDDQVISGDIAGLIRLAERRDVTGIAAWKSIYGLWYRGTQLSLNAAAGISALHLNRGNAHQVMALNTANVMRAGNYDEKLRVYEDGELARNAIRRGLPWMMYTGVAASGQASSEMIRARHGGGVADGDEAYYDALKTASRVEIARRWPEFISLRGASCVCYWKRLNAAYLPRNPYPPEDVTTKKPFDWDPE
jgi:hypothetical protein